MAKLYGVGVGPGDPGLITLRAKEVIESADVICVPKAKDDGQSIALKIISAYLNEQQILEVTMPMTRDEDKLRESWLLAAEQVAKLLQEQKTVVFPTLGDVTIYSTFGYLADAVQEILPEAEIEMIPGITSFSAAAAKLNVRLTEGSEPLLIVPDVEETCLEDILPKFNNVVLMKISAYWQQLKDTLDIKENKVFVVSRIGQEGEKVSQSLDSLDEKPDYLSLAIVKRRF